MKVVRISDGLVGDYNSMLGWHGQWQNYWGMTPVGEVDPEYLAQSKTRVKPAEKKNVTDELIVAVIDAMSCLLKQRKPPTRRAILEEIKRVQPDLSYPMLDRDLGLFLNRCVDEKILRRLRGESFAGIRSSPPVYLPMSAENRDSE